MTNIRDNSCNRDKCMHWHESTIMSCQRRIEYFSLLTLKVWKCGNMEMCLHCLFLLTLEVWKRGNVSWLSLSSNSRSVEVWKCGNVEMCLHCLYLITLQVCKSVNLEMCLTYPSPGRREYFLITGKWDVPLDGVVFSIELLEWGRTFLNFLG